MKSPFYLSSLLAALLILSGCTPRQSVSWGSLDGAPLFIYWSGSGPATLSNISYIILSSEKFADDSPWSATIEGKGHFRIGTHTVNYQKKGKQEVIIGEQTFQLDQGRFFVVSPEAKEGWEVVQKPLSDPAARKALEMVSIYPSES